MFERLNQFLLGAVHISVGRRASGKKGVESRVSGMKNVLTVLAVAIDAPSVLDRCGHAAVGRDEPDKAAETTRKAEPDEAVGRKLTSPSSRPSLSAQMQKNQLLMTTPVLD
jgi:hypothetical protein